MSPLPRFPPPTNRDGGLIGTPRRTDIARGGGGGGGGSGGGYIDGAKK